MACLNSCRGRDAAPPRYNCRCCGLLSSTWLCYLACRAQRRCSAAASRQKQLQHAVQVQRLLSVRRAGAGAAKPSRRRSRRRRRKPCVGGHQAVAHQQAAPAWQPPAAPLSAAGASTRAGRCFRGRGRLGACRRCHARCAPAAAAAASSQVRALYSAHLVRAACHSASWRACQICPLPGSRCRTS